MDVDLGTRGQRHRAGHGGSFSSYVEGVKDHMLLKKEEESFQVVAVTSTFCAHCTTIIGDFILPVALKCAH